MVYVRQIYHSYRDKLTDSGFKMTDLFGLAAFQGLLVVTLFAFILSLSRLSDPLNTFADCLGFARSIMPMEDADKTARFSLRRTLLILSMFAPVAAGMGGAAYAVLDRDELSPTWRYGKFSPQKQLFLFEQ